MHWVYSAFVTYKSSDTVFSRWIWNSSSQDCRFAAVISPQFTLCKTEKELFQGCSGHAQLLGKRIDNMIQSLHGSHDVLPAALTSGTLTQTPQNINHDLITPRGYLFPKILPWEIYRRGFIPFSWHLYVLHQWPYSNSDYTIRLMVEDVLIVCRRLFRKRATPSCLACALPLLFLASSFCRAGGKPRSNFVNGKKNGRRTGCWDLPTIHSIPPPNLPKAGER